MIESIEVAVVQWAEERGIFAKATPESQFGKTEEEMDELWEGIKKGNLAEIKDAIGDIIVTLTIQAHMHGFTLGQCFAAAYHEIKDRKGRMVNGVFVKEA